MGRQAKLMRLLATWLVALAWVDTAIADETSHTPSSITATESADAEARARQLFDQGNRLRAAGDCEGAVGYFLASRELLPSTPNTLNAAYCYYQLGQLDEALDLYEALLLDHGETLEEDLRSKLERRIAAILPQIARLAVRTTQPGATLVIDGRDRGSLSVEQSVVLMPGRHEVRIVKTGFVQALRRVDLVAGQRKTLSVELQPLTQRGVLRIASRAEASTPAVVWLDGASVGGLPFDAALAPGPHWVALEVGERGSGPQRITIIEGQVSLFEPELKPLGAVLRLSVSPPEAQLVLDGTPLLGSAFAGRLPMGKHSIRASAPGYISATQEIRVGPSEGRVLTLELAADTAHPRWRRPATSRVILSARARALLGSGLGSGPERCPGMCDSDGGARGAWLGAELDYRLPSNLQASASLGYGWMSTNSSRHVDQDVGTADEARYVLDDETRISGPWLAAGLGYVLDLSSWELSAQLHAGVMFAGIDLTTDGAVVRGADSAPVGVEHADRQRAALAFVLPEIELIYRTDNLRFGLAFGVLISPIGGSGNGRGEVGPIPDGNVDCAQVPAPVACARSSSLTKDELSVGRFVLFSPGVDLGWQF